MWIERFLIAVMLIVTLAIILNVAVGMVERWERRKRVAGVARGGSAQWVEWGGGECPVPAGVPVEVRLRGGWPNIMRGTAEEFRWGHLPPGSLGYPFDIVAYRVVKD